MKTFLRRLDEEIEKTVTELLLVTQKLPLRPSGRNERNTDGLTLESRDALEQFALRELDRIRYQRRFDFLKRARANKVPEVEIAHQKLGDSNERCKAVYLNMLGEAVGSSD